MQRQCAAISCVLRQIKTRTDTRLRTMRRQQNLLKSLAHLRGRLVKGGWGRNSTDPLPPPIRVSTARSGLGGKTTLVALSGAPQRRRSVISRIEVAANWLRKANHLF